MAKELAIDVIRLEVRMLLPEFCWALWLVTLVYYLVLFWVFQTGQFVEISFTLGAAFTWAMYYLMGFAYKRAYSHMIPYFGLSKWLVARYIVFEAWLFVVFVFWPRGVDCQPS